MAWYNEENPEILNFVLVGNAYSGHSVLQSSLNAHPEMVCHGELLSTSENKRKHEHEQYFGSSDKVLDWYQPHLISMEQYLNNKIFDNNLKGEKAIGVCLNYKTLYEGDLWDYLDQKCRLGDFCLIHVVRNPVACFLEQYSKAKKLQSVGIGAFRSYTVREDMLIKFVRSHVAAEMKVNQMFSDRAVIDYHELVLDFKGTLKNVFDFLDVPFSPACIPNRKNQNIRTIEETVSNYSVLKSELPLDVADFLESHSLV